MTTDTALAREDQVRLGLWMFLATVTMLFAAFASAYVVRRSGSDWRPVALPSILWWNTAILAASSAAVEIAAYVVQAFRPASSGRPKGLHYSLFAMLVALALGIAFLVGQLEAWRELRDAGVYLPTSPHSSFFFMLTGAHAVHVVAALAVLAWGAAGAADIRLWRARLTVCRTFWHYLGAVWVFLFAMMTLY